MTPGLILTKTEKFLCLLFPSLITLLLCFYGPVRYNLSGLLARGDTFPLTFLLCLSAGIFLALLFRRLLASEKKRRLILSAMAISGTCCILIKDNTYLGTQLHLLAGLILFVLVQAVLILTSFSTSAFRYYVMGLMLCLGTILYTANISGMSEMIYGWDLFLFFLKRTQG